MFRAYRDRASMGTGAFDCGSALCATTYRRFARRLLSGVGGAPGIGAGNLFLESASPLPPTSIFAGVKSGLYVTELIGQGVNMVTGDYSRGASGLWIENGELSYPVEGITIAGNLREMFQNITAAGDDMVFRSSVASPTLRIDGMTIAGS